MDQRQIASCEVEVVDLMRSLCWAAKFNKEYAIGEKLKNELEEEADLLLK
ncbi:hypothetical protein PPACK8108_LOCUS10951 [Phakopsora pachyrhizi]|uniref:Uncharacterized protein n=1 Tax=Phakopsora pachyrhizi TaxID=170000 RepID=A0AAV0B1F8_PHAPC|nr:hypothetical protein PPACK8108_LOCUS10951 [Phakopsora pachyrhizi]